MSRYPIDRCKCAKQGSTPLCAFLIAADREFVLVVGVGFEIPVAVAKHDCDPSALAENNLVYLFGYLEAVARMNASQVRAAQFGRVK